MGGDCSAEKRRAVDDFGGGGVGTRSRRGRLEIDAALVDRRRRVDELLRRLAPGSGVDCLASDGKIRVRRTIVELADSEVAALRATGLRTGAFSMTSPAGRCGDGKRLRCALEPAADSGAGPLKGGSLLPCPDLSPKGADKCLEL